MTKIKLCGLTRPCDIIAANRLEPEYIGFVFAPKSRRYVTPEKAGELKKLLSPEIRAAGVFVDEGPEFIARLLERGIISAVQLHGCEDEEYIARLRALAACPIIKAFCIDSAEDVEKAERSTADHILLDSGQGTGRPFDRGLIKDIKRPYFLAGGLSPDNVRPAVRELHPFAVDVSSGIETDGVKDETKMAAFVSAVRKEDRS